MSVEWSRTSTETSWEQDEIGLSVVELSSCALNKGKASWDDRVGEMDWEVVDNADLGRGIGQRKVDMATMETRHKVRAQNTIIKTKWLAENAARVAVHWWKIKVGRAE